MEPIRKECKEDMDKKLRNTELLKGLQEMTAANQKGLQEMTEAIMNGNRDRPNKLVKPTKVRSWSKGMKLEVYEKSLQVWMEMNSDLSEAVRYQDVIESLKVNKEIEGLAKYVGEHVIGKLDTIEKQRVKGIIELLVLEFWSSGVLEFWSFGVLEYWSFGVLEFWNLGVLDFWIFGVLEFWSFEVLEFWSFGISRFWSFGVLEFKSFGVLEFWSFRVLEF